MFDSLQFHRKRKVHQECKVYESVFELATRRESAGDDRRWAFGKSAGLKPSVGNLVQADFFSQRRTGAEVAQLAIFNTADVESVLRDFSNRFTSRCQPFPISPAFREFFGKQWHDGNTGGPLSQLILQQLRLAEDSALLIYDLTTWKLMGTGNTSVKPTPIPATLMGRPIPLAMLPTRVRLKLPPYKSSPGLVVPMKDLKFAFANGENQTPDDYFKVFSRVRGSFPANDFAEEAIATTALQDAPAFETSSLRNCFRADATGKTRGVLDCRTLIFAFLPKTPEMNPHIKSIRFLFEPWTGRLHSIAYVRQRFFGFCAQTAGLTTALGSLLSGTQL